jgi:3-isopropylmalate dehydrogenase
MDQASRRRGSIKRVAVLAGDGIGAEVIPDAVASLGDRFEIVSIDAGAERYLATGEPIGDEQVKTIAHSDALLFGAVGDPRVPDGILERGVILRLRKELDLYVNLRPFPELGIVFVRENTEGPYSGEGERLGDVATELNINTVRGVSRCVHYAFELASTRSGRLTLVHKSNVLRYAGDLWKEVVADVGKSYPGVVVSYEHADAAAYHLVRDPSRFDVVVTDNLFGDILSDLAAGISGGLGKAASANLHPDPSTRPTTCLGLFEPVHGSAPDIAGRGEADSTAAIRAAEMLLAALPAEAPGA